MYIRKGSPGEAPGLCLLPLLLRDFWTLKMREEQCVSSSWTQRDCGPPIDHCLGLYIPRLLPLLVEKATCGLAKSRQKGTALILP